MISLSVKTCDKVFRYQQPKATADFPTVSGLEPRIPHIIHQTYRDNLIPVQFADYVRSFVDNHPTWKFYFWTDESGRKLLAERHPHLLSTWDGYVENIKRSDMLRYLVLYEFGGVYADLDIESLRPLDRATMKYACVVPVEPFEHSVFLFGMPYMINNAILMCRAKHPFFKQVLNDLKQQPNITFINSADSVMKTTGPIFLTGEFNKYMGIENINTEKNKIDWSSNSPSFYKGEMLEADDNGVYVPNTHYFTDELDINYKEIFPLYCKYVKLKCNNDMYLNACFELHERGFLRKSTRFRFMRHNWHHTWALGNKGVFIKDEFVQLGTLASNYIIY
ncbi:hypothetical protein DPMN_097900 [Dreissena polymorpha]|uniref:Glycosyltransferase n=1 Tax=Dreissena polymorpha TaxID=45954 RepID=A0A9D4LCM1_DREPO|nr:hypothetical protein DPMN_097900 [Dreissena polymorpha]